MKFRGYINTLFFSRVSYGIEMSYLSVELYFSSVAQLLEQWIRNSKDMVRISLEAMNLYSWSQLLNVRT